MQRKALKAVKRQKQTGLSTMFQRTIEGMSQMLGHVLLIGVLLSCPIRCVMGGSACCADASTECQNVETDVSCCQQQACHQDTHATVDAGSNSGNSAHDPNSDECCRCDCLCKGAVPSAANITEFLVSALPIAELAPCVDSEVANTGANAHPPDVPNLPSGRDIRNLRMSFQV